ncbi:DEAD/DEAH box helicase [Arthrobacter agilis]|uniref:DEAD/DEAH box helicase n=1 Tax=Arthrobacter agilis TaxID=37921 RepID=UPI000B361C62|nr:DEAD/DEAH box helicase [Arthrobacter agilis]OUM43071.1 DEAD/DEAH box helicase [Arthrobacter agilis]PPB46016.1 ATP-dependent helicase [Arthrobacter agilis]TPV25555.1 DEAD/DEAH box helicase [Arthrobacter agilis]VDR33315.1 ATP-dependent RNA helicase rhlE [Arthrobacter agilis]
MTTFAALGVPKALVENLAAQGITEPFPIQVKSLPDSLAGRDVLGRGRTGSGKTLAFALPMVARLAEQEAAYRRKPGRPLALVLAPTRELATQINATVEPLAKQLGLNTTVIYGGVSQQRQEKALRAGVDIVIACPGRLEDLMRQKLITLESVEITILDEADHMADLGFLPVVKKLLDTTPADGQRLLFSATLDNGVDKVVNRYMTNPVTHSVDDPQAAVTTMEHHVLMIGDQTQKKQLIVQLASGSGRRLLFMRTKHHARKLAKTLTDAGIPAVDLHGNLSQNARDRNLAEFSSGDVRVLVATDVAARGVHVDDVELVVHVDPPTEHKAYLHRSGRTARAGSSGTVVTITLPEQKSEVHKLMKAAGVDVAFETVKATSPLVLSLTGDVADKIDPRTRAALLASRETSRGEGTSTGANAQRKRARRGAAAPVAGGRGGRGGRGRVSADPQAAQGNRADRRKDQPQAPRFGSDAPKAGGSGRRTAEPRTTSETSTRSRRPATGQRAADGTRRPSTGGAPSGGSQRVHTSSSAPRAEGGARRSGGSRRASAPASNDRRPR